MKWTKLTRAKAKDMDSTKIISEQIATELNKEVSQLAEDDLIELRELSLTGTYVFDLTYISKLPNLESLDISFTYVDNVNNLLHLEKLKKLNISSTDIKDIRPLKNLRQLKWLSIWNLWLDREQIDELKEHLPNLKIPDYQWDLYEKDSIGRVVPKLRVRRNESNSAANKTSV
jgi:hypothetical protein